MSTKRPSAESGKDLVLETYDLMKLARAKAGLEQEDMAEYLGVSTSTISNWENGRSSVKVAFLRGWAEKTGYNMSSLIPEDRQSRGRSLRVAKGPDHARAIQDRLDADNALRAAIADPDNTVDDGEVYVAWAEGKPFRR